MMFMSITKCLLSPKGSPDVPGKEMTAAARTLTTLARGGFIAGIGVARGTTL
jgi:hypothetical protein